MAVVELYPNTGTVQGSAITEAEGRYNELLLQIQNEDAGNLSLNPSLSITTKMTFSTYLSIPTFLTFSTYTRRNSYQASVDKTFIFNNVPGVLEDE